MNWKFSGDRPVYQQIMELMRGGIVKGELPPGGKIPRKSEKREPRYLKPSTEVRSLHYQRLRKECRKKGVSQSNRFVTIA